MGFEEEKKKFWNKSSVMYTKSIKSELLTEEATIWQKILLENAPEKEVLEVLDIGTGPGFFAILLSLAGHRVTGIDMSPRMLETARENAAAYDISPEFQVMNAQELTFEDNSFDLIVNRNVTWTLTAPEKAYREWKRVLRPGGRLLIFDANWMMVEFVKESREEMYAGIRKYRELHNDLPPRYSMFQYETYWKNHGLLACQRPLWDKITLWKLGFQNIVIADDINERTYMTDINNYLYNCEPLFMVRAEKVTPEEERERDVLEHWNGRAPIQGVFSVRDVLEGSSSYERKIRPFLPEGGGKVLDAGCGAGSLSALMVRDGYEVVSADFSPLMLMECQYTAEKAGVELKTEKVNFNETIPFEDGAFDVVLANELLWTLFQPQKALAEFRRVLKKGGRLIIGDSNKYLHTQDETSYREYVSRWNMQSETTLNLVYGAECSKSSVIDELKDYLPLSDRHRPQWDVESAKTYAFQVISCEEYEETETSIASFVVVLEAI